MSWWSRARARLEQLFAAYGDVAVGVYLALFLATLGGLWAALSAGFQLEGAAAGAGTLGGAYAITKLLQPVRIGITVVLTPFVARALGRSPAAPQTPAPPPQDSAT